MGDLLEQLDSWRALGYSTANINAGSNNQPHALAPPPLNSVRQVILRRLDALEMREGEVLEEWPELKSAWNRSLAVTQLPNEILFNIFVYVSELPADYIQKYDGFLEIGPVKRELMKLTAVCRRWRDVALATPALWRTIEVGQTSGWLNLALTRSGDATIDVSFPSDFYEEHASLLTPHCRRLRSLRLQYYSPRVIRVIRNTLPALRTLEIHSNPLGMEAKRFYVDLGIARERFPNLRTLQLGHNILPRDPSFYPQLRKLSLKACHFKGSIDLEQFVQLLAACICLEHLELGQILESLSDSGNDGPLSPLPLSLRSLRLSGHLPVDSARFFSRVVVSPTTSVLINTCISLEEAEWGHALGVVTDQRGNTLRAVVPTGPSLSSSLPGLATVTRARLSVAWENGIECFSTPSGRDGDEVLVLEIVQESSFRCMEMADGFVDLLTLLGSAPLAHLEIIGQSSSVGAEMWARVFRAFPSLVSLVADAGVALFDGLREASLASSAVSCPGLERLSINKRWKQSGRLDGLFKPLILCLQCRADRGSRLKEVYLDFRGNLDDVKTYLPCLQELVAKVELV